MVTMRYGKWFWYMVFVGGFSYLFAEVGVLGSGEDGVDIGELALIDFGGAVLFFGASIALTILWGIRNLFSSESKPGALIFLRISFLTAFTTFFIGGIAVAIVRAVNESVGFDMATFLTFLISLVVMGTASYREELKEPKSNGTTTGGVVGSPQVNVSDEIEIAIRAAYQNHTKEQQNVAFYFAGLKSPLNDKKYEALVESKLKALNFYNRALDRCGIDDSELREITPLLIQGYNFDGNVWVKRTSSGKFVSSAYQVTYIFFTNERVYLYRANFELDEGGEIPQDESGQGFYFQDVVSLGSKTNSQAIGKYGVNVTVSFSTLIFSMTSGEHFVIPVDGEKTIRAVRAKWHEERTRRNLKD